MAKKKRGTGVALLMYLSVIAVLFLGVSVGVASLIETPIQRLESKRAKTLLEKRIATAREIRAALARPLPPVPPLPPITAKLANPEGSKAVVRSAFDVDKRKLSKEARNAMAMQVVPPQQEQQTVAPQTSQTYRLPDRGSLGGW